jgi:hypothetical protein
LTGVDAPESGQKCLDAKHAFVRCGSIAANALDKWLARNPVTCAIEDKDRYGRFIGKCSVRGVNIQDWQKKQAQNSCRSKQECFGAVAITHSEKPAGIVLVTASAEGKNDVNHTSGTLEAHEYAHIIQDELQGRYLGQVPRWQAEGEAMFAQAAAIHHLDFSAYNLERKRIIKGLINNREISESWLVDFISPASGLIKWQAWDKYDGGRVYDVGMLITEILTSLKGPESTMRLSAEVGTGVSYQRAFEKIYGLTWKSAVPMLAKIIYSEINS